MEADNVKRLTLTIPGVPIAKARPKFARHGKFVRAYSPQKKEEHHFKLLLQSQCAAEGFKPIPRGVPILLTLYFYMPMPQTFSKKRRQEAWYHVKRPDLDNLTKFFLDCANGILWHDDSQVASLIALKIYAKEEPVTAIQVAWHKEP